jgi:hypothetical protein
MPGPAACPAPPPSQSLGGASPVGEARTTRRGLLALPRLLSPPARDPAGRVRPHCRRPPRDTSGRGVSDLCGARFPFRDRYRGCPTPGPSRLQAAPAGACSRLRVGPGPHRRGVNRTTSVGKQAHRSTSRGEQREGAAAGAVRGERLPGPDHISGATGASSVPRSTERAPGSHAPTPRPRPGASAHAVLRRCLRRSRRRSRGPHVPGGTGGGAGNVQSGRVACQRQKRRCTPSPTGGAAE